jgi:hypothetical protein
VESVSGKPLKNGVGVRLAIEFWAKARTFWFQANLHLKVEAIYQIQSIDDSFGSYIR